MKYACFSTRRLLPFRQPESVLFTFDHINIFTVTTTDTAAATVTAANTSTIITTATYNNITATATAIVTAKILLLNCY